MLIPISYKLCFPFLIFIFECRQGTILWTVVFCTFMLLCTICSLEASLRFELASETSKAASQWDRIQQLQNDLIKVGKCLRQITSLISAYILFTVYRWVLLQKNDSEKKLLKLQRVQQQQEDLQHHQGCLRKMATLEATVKQKEKVRSAFHMLSQQLSVAICALYEYPCAIHIFQIIENMQKMLDSKLREENEQSGDKRLVVKKQTGRLTQWSERDCMGSKKQLVRTSLRAEQATLTTRGKRSSQPWWQKTVGSDRSWTGWASSPPNSRQHR